MLLRHPSIKLLAVLILSFLFTFLLSASLFAQLPAPRLVKDINTDTPNSYPSSLVEWKGELYFAAVDKINGVGLWKSDGSDDGTTLIKAVYPGEENFVRIERLFPTSDTLYFDVRGTDFFSRSLWQSDGSTNGTTVIKSESADFSYNFPFGMLGGKFLFSAYDPIHGSELWRTDGTEVGTQLVKDMTLTNTRSTRYYTAIFSDTLYLFTPDLLPDGSATSWALWRSDGTESGTTKVKSFNSLSITDGKVIGDRFYYLTYQNQQLELWATDFTTTAPALIKILGSSQNYLYGTIDALSVDQFIVRTSSGPNSFWVSDGTISGTQSIGNIPIPQSNYGSFVHNGSLYFNADTTFNDTELWKSNGTITGTALVKNINVDRGSSYPRDFVGYNNWVYFFAEDGIHGAKLWRTDGTEAGTTLVKDVNPGVQSSAVNRSFQTAVVNDKLFFAAYDYAHGYELRVTDGTEAGTRLVKDINFVETDDSCPSSFTWVDGKLFFMASTNATGRELWATDGNGGTTFQLADLAPGFLGISSEILTPSSNRLYFSSYGSGIWQSDGTISGTAIITSVSPYIARPAQSSLATFQDYLYFATNRYADFENFATVWRFNSTNNEIVPIKDFESSFTQNIDGFSVVGSQLYFAYYGSPSASLWKSDGLVAAQIAAIPDSNFLINPPRWMTGFRGNLFYVAGTGLWKSDGTSSGTLQVKSIEPLPQNLAVFGDFLYFTGNYDQSFWRSDGTQTGTILLRSGPIGEIKGNVQGAYFVVNNNSKVPELWHSDGSLEGTQLINRWVLTDTRVTLSALTLFQEQLYFVVEQPEQKKLDKELWTTDGTTVGTIKVMSLGNLIDDTDNNCAAALSANGNRLFLTRNDGLRGQELWVIESEQQAWNDHYTTIEDNALAVSAPGVLKNDPDHLGPFFNMTLTVPPSHGSVQLNIDGSFIYTPTSNFFGTDIFTYSLRNNGFTTETASVSIRVRAVNDAPIALGDNLIVDRGGTTSVLDGGAVSILVNDSDVDSGAFTLALVKEPKYGSLQLTPSGQFTYTHSGGSSPIDYFTYKLNDGITESTVATVTIHVAQAISFTLSKTVGIQGIQPQCTASGEIKVPVNTTVLYCYTIMNTGNLPLAKHTLVDSHLGKILNDEVIELTPGSLYSKVVAQELTINTTNVATWTATMTGISFDADATFADLSTQSQTAATVIISSASDDQDSDGIPDNIERAKDVDNDNLPNFLDTDSDGDTVSDQVEAGGNPLQPVDSDNNGTPDYLQNTPNVSVQRAVFLPLVQR